MSCPCEAAEVVNDLPCERLLPSNMDLPTGYATSSKQASGEVKKETTRGEEKQTEVPGPLDQLRGEMIPIREEVFLRADSSWAT